MISQALFIRHSGARTLLSGLPAAVGSCMVVQTKSDPPQRTKALLPVALGGAERASGKQQTKQHELLP